MRLTDSYSVSSKMNLKLSLHSSFLKQKKYENTSAICKPYREEQAFTRGAQMQVCMA